MITVPNNYYSQLVGYDMLLKLQSQINVHNFRSQIQTGICTMYICMIIKKVDHYM